MNIGYTWDIDGNHKKDAIQALKEAGLEGDLLRSIVIIERMKIPIKATVNYEADFTPDGTPLDGRTRVNIEVSEAKLQKSAIRGRGSGDVDGYDAIRRRFDYIGECLKGWVGIRTEIYEMTDF